MSTTKVKDREAIKEAVQEALKEVYDPEIPVDIYELGLIYEVEVDDDYNVNITMTLTSPACPVAGSLPMTVQKKAMEVDGVNEAHVNLTFDPPWSKDRMSEEAKLELGLM